MDRVIIRKSPNFHQIFTKKSSKENDTKKNKKRMVQPFKMERDYNDDIRDTDNNNIQQYHDDWRTLEMTPRTGENNMDDYEDTNEYIIEQVFPELVASADFDEWHESEEPEKQTYDYPGSSGGIWGFVVITIKKEDIEKTDYSFEDIKNAIELNKDYLDPDFLEYKDMASGSEPYFEEEKAEIKQDENGNMIIEIPYEAEYSEDVDEDTRYDSSIGN